MQLTAAASHMPCRIRDDARVARHASASKVRFCVLSSSFPDHWLSFLISACMRWTKSVNTEVHRISTCHQFILGAHQSNVQGPPSYAIAITRPEDVQTGEAIAAADASTNGAPAAMEITKGDTSAELPAGELKWDPPSGEHTGHSELHMCQLHDLRVARACEGAVPVAGTLLHAGIMLIVHELLTVLEDLQGSRGGESASFTAASRSQHAGGRKFLTSLSLLRALPWRKFKKGSALVIELGGEVITFCYRLH